MVSNVSSTRGFRALSIAASDMLAWSSSSSSSSRWIGLPSASTSGSSVFSSAGTAPLSPTTLSVSSPSSWVPNVASRSMTSRSRITSDSSSSRQMVIAPNVSGLSHSPAIIVFRPASMRLAMAISPSRLSSSTEPISRRYIRTGSSVRSSFSASAPPIATSRPAVVTTSREAEGWPSSDSSLSSSSVTWMPISDSIDITSSIWSDET